MSLLGFDFETNCHGVADLGVCPYQGVTERQCTCQVFAERQCPYQGVPERQCTCQVATDKNTLVKV